MRTQYIVTLEFEDGRLTQITLWAESPEHAIKKAKARSVGKIDRATAVMKGDG